jgi:hypothetical protein
MTRFLSKKPEGLKFWTGLPAQLDICQASETGPITTSSNSAATLPCAY